MDDKPPNVTDDLLPSLNAVVEQIRILAAEHSELRAAIRRLAEAVLRSTEEPRAAAETPPSVEVVPEQATAAPAVTVAAPARPLHEPLPTVSGIEVPVGWLKQEAIADADLPLIEARCRLKAEGARWAAERHRRMTEGVDFRTDIEPRDREIIEQEKSLQGCFLWMNHASKAPSPTDLTLWEDVAGCFDALGAGISLVRTLFGDPDHDRGLFERSLDLLAESQSALRVAIENIDANPDTDQEAIFGWLRITAAQQQIFIERFMRIADRGDPQGWADLSDRIEKVDLELQQVRQREKQRQAWINRLRYHTSRIRSAGGGEHDWRRVAETVAEMITDGVPPSNIQIRELLLPIIDSLPEEVGVPEGFQLVLREIDRFLATCTPSASEAFPAISSEVKQVARLLHGKSALLIGGDQRPYAKETLRNALNLRELTWITTREHESLDIFEPYVARSDVALVLLAIRWSSHSYGEVRQFCQRYGKPLVRLPGGYGPNQVAFQVLRQCGDRLRGSRQE